MKIHTIDLYFQGHPHSIASYLIEHNGEIAIVETGPHSTLPNLLKGIQALGFRAKNVKQVFLTHVHLDHAGAAWYFAQLGAKVYVHPAGEKHLIDPTKLYNSAKMIYQDQMESLWGQMNPIPADQVQIIQNGEQVPFAGTYLTAWHTPGHAVHHIAWQWGKDLFTGDVAGVKILGGPAVPPCPPPDINIEDWIASIQLIKRLGVKRLHLAHFGEVAFVQRHLTALAHRLAHWAVWMEPYYKQGVSQAEVTPKFMAFTMKELKRGGVSKELLEVYENANPSWMGVAGLMRYWHKRSEREMSEGKKVLNHSSENGLSLHKNE